MCILFQHRERADLGTAFAAVGATDELDMATAMLVAATVPSLESLHKYRYLHKNQ